MKSQPYARGGRPLPADERVVTRKWKVKKTWIANGKPTSSVDENSRSEN
jgi:hypothetical protein